MIEGSLVRLRSWQETDVPALMALRNDATLQAKLLSIALGSDESQVRSWLEKRTTGKENAFFVIVDTLNDSTIGYIQFTNIDYINQNAELGICINSSAQGKGKGTESIKLALSGYCVINHIYKVGLRVRCDNDNAIRCYERIGFERCGLLKKHIIIDTQWHDVVLMEYTMKNNS